MVERARIPVQHLEEVPHVGIEGRKRFGFAQQVRAGPVPAIRGGIVPRAVPASPDRIQRHRDSYHVQTRRRAQRKLTGGAECERAAGLQRMPAEAAVALCALDQSHDAGIRPRSSRLQHDLPGPLPEDLDLIEPDVGEPAFEGTRGQLFVSLVPVPQRFRVLVGVAPVTAMQMESPPAGARSLVGAPLPGIIA